jgi:lipopolysaccharide biosynthesis glycosyltransferase
MSITDQPEVIRIFVGADRSQEKAIDVLEYSIRRHTSRAVEVHRMIDLHVPTPKDPRNAQRTGFSFSRFCIPKLAGYRGKAIYMDADMLVFRNVEELWELEFNNHLVLVQQELGGTDASRSKENAPTKRVKQCAVMLLDCSRLQWDIAEIVGGLDRGEYSYEQLMSELCIVPEGNVGYSVPFTWNSLEHFDDQTRLLHFTDMGTQPWVSTRNGNGDLWLAELRDMLSTGAFTMKQIEQEIKLGYFRPSLIRDLRWKHWLPRFMHPAFSKSSEAYDAIRGFVAHKAVYEAKRQRQKAVQDFERHVHGASN